MKIVNLLADDRKNSLSKQTAYNHPIIKSARSRLEK